MNDFVRNEIEADSWIGLNDQDNEGHYQWAHEDWKLQGYTNWRTPGLSSSSSAHDCVYMKSRGDMSGKWISTSCDEEMSFVCERRSASDRQDELGI